MPPILGWCCDGADRNRWEKEPEWREEGRERKEVRKWRRWQGGEDGRGCCCGGGSDDGGAEKPFLCCVKWRGNELNSFHYTQRFRCDSIRKEGKAKLWSSLREKKSVSVSVSWAELALCFWPFYFISSYCIFVNLFLTNLIWPFINYLYLENLITKFQMSTKVWITSDLFVFEIKLDATIKFKF